MQSRLHTQRVLWLSLAISLVVLLFGCAVMTAQHNPNLLVWLAQQLGAPAKAQAAPTTLRFAVIGDYGDGSAAEASVANLIKSWQPALIATVGDNNYPAGSATTIDTTIGQYFHEYIYPYNGGYGTTEAGPNRFFPALGNHDWQAMDCGAITCTGAYLDYFTLPGNERYYDIEQGPVHLFFVDSDPHEPDGRTSDSLQATWLHDQLAASTAVWNLVFMHHPPYSSGQLHGSTAEMQWPYAQWGADAVLAGHDHTYERIMVDNFPYFVDGLGKEHRAFGTPVAGSAVRYNSGVGAMLVEASPVTITFQFINVANAVIDSYTLTNSVAPATPVVTPATPTVTAAPTVTATPTATVTPTVTPEATPPGGTGCNNTLALLPSACPLKLYMPLISRQ